MERSLVLVLTLVTLVTATPHGYGVKSGASAKAEASAVAGAFGGLGPLPLSIPSGAAYSGSFSKSSSSSFASSSASSSSSSYSFSGSGANGIAGLGTNKGCSSGTCPGIEATGPNRAQPFHGANAVSSAQAKGLSGAYSPCQGSNCNGNVIPECSSGKCSTDETSNGHNECSTGNCQQTPSSSPTDVGFKGSSEKGHKENEEGASSESNDFAVNLNRKPQSKSSLDLNGQYYNKEKPHDSGSDCSNGKCGTDNSYQINNLGQSPQPVPATYLTTPKEKPPCTTPNCNYPSQDNFPQTGGLPSSYNVPIQSATNPPNTYYSSPTGPGKQTTYSNTENGGTSGAASGPCTSGNCNVGASPNPSNYHFGQQEPTNQGPCASGQCNIPTSLHGKTTHGAESGVTAPSHPQGGVPSNEPSGGCKNSYCAGIPSYSSLPTYQPNSGCSGTACAGASQAGSPTKPSSSSDTPVYSGGFGGPSGFLDKTGGSAYDHGHKQVGGYGSNPIRGPVGATKPHEFGPTNNHGSAHTGSTGSFGAAPVHQTIGTTKPNDLNANNYDATQTSSNGGSNGFYGYNKPSNVPSAPGSQYTPSYTDNTGAATASSTPGSHTHSVNNGIYKPTTTNTGNSPSYSGGVNSYDHSRPNSIQESFGLNNANIPLNSQNTPGYTSNVGGAPVTSGGSGSTFGSSELQNKHVSGSCGSESCNGQPDTNVNGGTTVQKKPTYTGGFGGPTGFLKPNDFSVPSNTQTVPIGSNSCANGNCGAKDASSPHQDGSLSSAHSLLAATATANAAAYSGGFGGPPGVLKPFDNGKGNIPESGHSHNSDSGNPNTRYSNGKNLKPESSPNAANAAAQASATASATAGAYGGNNNYQNNNGGSHGCNSGCSLNGDGAGSPDGLAKHGVGAGSIANAKSSAGAYGIGGSFASSSASAHASAGTPTKGGYGRK